MGKAAEKVVNIHDKPLDAVYVEDTRRYHKYQVKADRNEFIPQFIYLPKDKSVPKTVTIKLSNK